MNVLRAYGRTLRQYWRNPKNRHDGADFARAAVIIALTVLAACGSAYMFFGKR